MCVYSARSVLFLMFPANPDTLVYVHVKKGRHNTSSPSMVYSYHHGPGKNEIMNLYSSKQALGHSELECVLGPIVVEP